MQPCISHGGGGFGGRGDPSVRMNSLYASMDHNPSALIVGRRASLRPLLRDCPSEPVFFYTSLASLRATHPRRVLCILVVLRQRCGMLYPHEFPFPLHRNPAECVFYSMIYRFIYVLVQFELSAAHQFRCRCYWLPFFCICNTHEYLASPAHELICIKLSTYFALRPT
jgi:hypothetical protein